MRRALVGSVVIVGALAASVRGQGELLPSGFPQAAAPPPRSPGVPAPPANPATQPKGPTGTPQPKGSETGADRAAERQNDQFSQPNEAGSVAATSANENFDGDFGGVFYKQTVLAGITLTPQVVGFTPRVVGQTQTVSVDPRTGQKVVTTTPVVVQDPITVQVPSLATRVVRLPVATRYSGVFITDNDNPRPADRVYFGYTYYDRLGASLNPGVGGSNLNREMVGFESTYLGGDASFGMRLPVVQQYGPAGLSTQAIGDLTLLSKFVLLGDRRTGDLWSAGLALTAPTGGGNVILADGTRTPHSWLFQPWTGVVWIAGRGYAQGITSVVAPTDRRDPTLFNNSLAFGYQVYRGTSGSGLSAVTPAMEVHVRTPLNHRDPNGIVYVPDQVSVTGTVHVRTSRLVFSPAINVPLTGPKPWAVEAMAFLNVAF